MHEARNKANRFFCAAVFKIVAGGVTIKNSACLCIATHVEKRNLAKLCSKPGRETAPGFLHDAFATAHGVNPFLRQKEDNACSSKKAKAATRLADRADRETWHPFECRRCWSKRRMRSSTRLSNWPSPAISGRYDCAWIDSYPREQTSLSFARCRRCKRPATRSAPSPGSHPPRPPEMSR